MSRFGRESRPRSTLSTTAACGDRSEVALEPVDDALQAVDPAVGAAGFHHQVELVRVAHHLDGSAEAAEHRECDLGLAGGTAQVALGLEQEERRLVSMEERTRG